MHPVRITPEYLALNKQLHEQNKAYGVGGKRWINEVLEFRNQKGIGSILDYGCGKALLSEKVGNVINYDPCIPKYSDEPPICDMVLCTDVLEHIEPELLENVLDHIEALALRFVWLAPTVVDSNKLLPDGTSPHRIIKPQQWWLDLFKKRWEPIRVEHRPKQLVFIGGVHEVGG